MKKWPEKSKKCLNIQKNRIKVAITHIFLNKCLCSTACLKGIITALTSIHGKF